MEIPNKQKLKLIIVCIDLLLKEVYENKNDPITKLFFSYDEANAILNLNNLEFTELRIIKYLYFNRNTIHQILYNEYKVINIIKIKNQLNAYFYLILLINENIDYVNYCFSIDLIKKINNEQEKNDPNEVYKFVLTAIIIIELIEIYTNQFDYNEEENKELENIEKSNKSIIKNNIIKFQEIGLFWNENIINDKKIDEIYIEIIIALIKSKKLNDNDILNQLDLKYIYLTKKMLDILNNFFQTERASLNSYKITNFWHIYDENKIEFYYILFEYILKSPIYIFQIPFLLEIRKNLINIIKFDLNQSSISSIDNSLQKNMKKIKYIVYFFTGSQYYYNQFSNYLDQITKINTSDNSYSKILNKVPPFQNINIENSEVKSYSFIFGKNYDDNFEDKEELIK